MNWAVVIGIDQYWIPEASLRAAVADAVKMFGWLIDPKGGAVPSHNIALLLSPLQGSSSALPGVSALPAGHGEIVESIERLLLRSGGEGERLFFYFSGHGVMSRMDFSNESGIVAADFKSNVTTNSLTVRSIFERFQATRFREQFFFIDACRNIPWDREFRIGQYPNPLPPVPPVPPQFIMFATSPCLKARELRAAGYEGGAFTTALLEGLHGAGSAKEWDDKEYAYVVRWDRLFRYVEGEVRRQRLRVEPEDAQRAALIQEPRQFGERGSSNPVLGRFSSTAFGPERLDVCLDPEEIAHVATVAVGDLGGTVDQTSPIKTLPVQFSLAPKTYSVRAEAPNYRSERPYYPVDLYEASTVTVKLESGQPHPPPARFIREATRGKPTTPIGTLTVSSPDPFGQIEIRDTSAQLLSSGQGRVVCRNAPAGFYRAILRSPEGRAEEQLIAFVPGQTDPVALHAPILPEGGVLREVLEQAGIPQSADNCVEPSGAMGPVSAPRLSTILALAAGAANEVTPYGERLRRTGVRPFQSTAGGQFTSGVQVVCGFENVVGHEVAAHLASVRLRLQRQLPPGVTEEERHLHPFGLVGGLGQTEWGTAAGVYWLTLDLPDLRTITVPTHVLPGRLTLVIIHRDREGKNRMFQFMPSLLGDDPNDPLKGLARFPVLQRSELIQRYAVAGRLDGPELSALELRAGKWVEPVAACVEALRLLKARRYDDLSDMTGRLTRDFVELTDGWVLRAAYHQVREARNEAQAGYCRALQLGLPALGECLDLLVRGMEDYGIEHPLKAFVKDLSARRLRAMLWTACYAADINALVPGVAQAMV